MSKARWESVLQELEERLGGTWEFAIMPLGSRVWFSEREGVYMEISVCSARDNIEYTTYVPSLRHRQRNFTVDQSIDAIKDAIRGK